MMKIYNYFGKEQRVYYDKLDNGLDIYILPNSHVKGYNATLVTKYGGDVKEFIPINEKKYFNIPLGTAHFLEHKVYDMENEKAFDVYARNGVYSNASTNNMVTRFYISGKKNFKKNLNYLLKMVYSLYLTEETVNNEMGIISEEINMYDDDPEWQLDLEFRKNFYHFVTTNKVSGTCKTIRTITKEILEKVFYTFYQPSNMFLVVTGNVKKKDILEVVKKNEAINQMMSNCKIIYREPKETKSVVNEYQEIKGDIVFPKVKYGFKFDLNDFDVKDKNYLIMCLDAIFSCLFNDASYFSEKIKEQKLANWFYAYYGLLKDNIYYLIVEGISECPDLFIEEINHFLQKIDISEEELNRIKKVWYSSIIRSLDNYNYLADDFIDDVIDGVNEIDKKNLFDNVNIDDIQSIIKQLDFSQKTLVLMLPKDQ